MSKEDLIKTIETEVLKPDTYLFLSYINQLIKEGQKNHPFLIALDTLYKQTWLTVKEKKIKLQAKYSKKMKILTILSCFAGCTTYNLAKLSRELNCSLEETLDLLLEASIFKLITVKIDESKYLISISNSKLRERESGSNPDKFLSGKLTEIKEKNLKLQKKITGLVKEIGGKSAIEEIKDESLKSKFKW